MSRRIDIELTSSQSDGSWTWRAAGAKNPKGVVDGAMLPDGARVGDELKLEIEQEIDGITVLGIVQGKAKADRSDLLDLLPSDRPFEAVIETRAKRDRGGRDGGRDGGGRDGRRRDGGRDGRRGGREGGGREGGGREGGGREGGGREGGGRDGRRQRPDRQRADFTPPPEVPQRPKPKRLRPGKAHRSEVLNALPEEQRPIAELALQGMAAVRQRLKEENARLVADGKAEMPVASVIKLAEDLLPQLRVAEWQDRAEAAKRQMEHLDLRDLRSVVAASDDPMVTRDESTRQLAVELRESLVKKQEHELALWLEDIDVALNVGRVIRALRLSSQPPKAGVPFPSELATKLADATNESLAPTDGPDRWSAVLEAAAFSPVRAAVLPAAVPSPVSAELTATMKRLGPLLPQVALLLGIEVPENAPTPKPLRPNRKDGKDAKDGKGRRDRKGRGKREDGRARGADERGGRDGGRRTDRKQPNEKRADDQPTRDTASSQEHSEAPGQAPAAPIETTAAPVEPPAAAAEARIEAPDQTPAAPVEAPAAPAETPAAPAEAPAAPAETPAAPAEAPAAPAEAPDEAPVTATEADQPNDDS